MADAPIFKRVNYMYVRRVFEHDITHELSVSSEIVKSFFNNKNSNIKFIKDFNSDTTYNVSINNATDVRFGGQFKEMYVDDNIEVNDFIIISRLKNDIYSLSIIKKDDQFWNLFNELVDKIDINKRHTIISSEEFEQRVQNSTQNNYSYSYRPYITAIKSKPFLLLAGISGTGKSRIVRELARACWEVGSNEYKAQVPPNFKMIQVKPNWHDSSELIGYVSRINGEPEFVAGEFLKFVAKAWEHKDTPYFLCLDEMNLAPVEQYFAEYLSVIESRKTQEDGTVLTDPILNASYHKDSKGNIKPDEWYEKLILELLTDCPDDKSFGLKTQFEEKGISIPQNLIVVGTVNMDETTFSFSRKVLDRAMTIEMNEVNLMGGLEDDYEQIGKLGNNELVGTYVEGKDVYAENKDVCNLVIDYLQAVNDNLEHTPFKIAYRTRNEFLLYVVNNLPYNKDEEGNDIPVEQVIARALDEITSMKILSRIEGDDSKVKKSMLSDLRAKIIEKLTEISETFDVTKSVSIAKIDEMAERLDSGYTSFWS